MNFTRWLSKWSLQDWISQAGPRQDRFVLHIGEILNAAFKQNQK